MAITYSGSAHFTASPRPGFLARWFERIAEGRMEQARGVVKPHLLALDDEALATLGYKRAEIRRWRDAASEL